jgi:hypothetical protein
MMPRRRRAIVVVAAAASPSRLPSTSPSRFPFAAFAVAVVVAPSIAVVAINHYCLNHLQLLQKHCSLRNPTAVLLLLIHYHHLV